MITLQHLFYGSLTPWTNVFRPENKSKTIIRHLSPDYSHTGMTFFRDLPPLSCGHNFSTFASHYARQKIYRPK